ncbi:MAG: class I SAM-dependent methyltransferase [Myxococcales bacterium]|nr:class I SAM-dependent methyltransferase [Myxococcales bacterium]
MLMAAIYDRFMDASERACLAEWRAELLSVAAGEVLEIGAGTGANLPLYGADVERLVLTEPDRFMARKLAPKLAPVARRRRVELLSARAEALPFADASFDFVVTTLVLCSVGELDRALRELRRVLRPGGRLLFLEHVAAGDERPDRLAWQRRIEPVWRRIAGNCHLTRVTDRAIERAGFELGALERASVRKALPWVRPSIRGWAR